MGLTDKQKSILSNDGYDDESIGIMSYDQASELIGHILARKPKKQFSKALPAPKASYDSSDKKSFYVAYAKDLCIAMLQAHAEARKTDPKIELMSVESLMHEAIRLITLAKRNNF